MIVEYVREGDRCEVRVFELRCNILNFITLEHLISNLESVYIEQSLVSHDRELNMFARVDIRVDSDGIDGSSVSYQAAPYDQSTLQVPNGQIVFTLDSHRNKVLGIVREGKGLDATLVERVLLQQLPIHGVIEKDQGISHAS